MHPYAAMSLTDTTLNKRSQRKKMYKWHDVYRTQEQEALIDSDRSQGSGYL